MISECNTTWLQIRNRLHENTGLQDPENEVGKLLSICVGQSIDDFEDFIDEHLMQAFLNTSEGSHLDRIGDEYGIERLIIDEVEEDDASYRQRILNALVLLLTLPFLERMGLRLFSKKELELDTRIYISSCNPHTKNLYDAIALTTVAKKYVLENVIYEYTMQVHRKGW